MIINPDILRRDTVELLKSIEAQINQVKKEARQTGISPEEMRDANRNWVMSPLLLAKAQAYATLVMLQTRPANPGQVR
jgi:hypothetical protein